MRTVQAILIFTARDIIVRWRSSLATISLVAAVTAPLLVFFAIREGYVSELRAGLTDTPSVRELKLDGQKYLGSGWFDEMASRPDVAFVVPRTRHLNTSIKLRSPKDRGLPPLDVELVPTGPADPMLPDSAQGLARGETVLVSARVARLLQLAPGQAVEAIVRRLSAGGPETRLRRLMVAHILPTAAHSRDALFVDPALMLAVERYREGGTYELVPLRQDETVASFRLFARTADDVAPLALDLERRGLGTITEATRIAEARATVRALNLVVWLLATILILGGLVSIAGGLSAAAIARASDLSVLRMLGYRSMELAVYPLALALSLATVGAVLGFAIYAAAAAIIRSALPRDVTFDTRALEIGVEDAATTLAVTIAASALASIGATRHSLSLDATKRLRDG